MRTLVMILQFMCLALTGTGIVSEWLRGIDIGPLLIAAGSLIFAISVKVNKVALLRELKQLRNSHKNDNHGESMDPY